MLPLKAELMLYELQHLHFKPFAPWWSLSPVCFCFQGVRALAADRLNFPLLLLPPEVPQVLADLRSIL